MPGPPWDRDDPSDADRIADNVRLLLVEMHHEARDRALPDLDTMRAWHRRVYDGVAVPTTAYVGAFRGDPSRPELVGYEIGVGVELADGLPDRVGVWSDEVEGEVATFLTGFHGALAVLDAAIAVGRRRLDADQVQAVVSVVAEVHGDWVRIHPFANGNGRTARLWAAFVCLRYGLPVFVTVKPRPDDVAYARAARASMGRPPDFVGDHTEATAVFAHLLTEFLRTAQ